mgnify:FL=1
MDVYATDCKGLVCLCKREAGVVLDFEELMDGLLLQAGYELHWLELEAEKAGVEELAEQEV